MLEGRDSATPLRCAPNDMWGGGSGMGPAPRPRGQRGGAAGRAVRNKPLPDGCQTGGRDGSPPPVFTGAGSRRGGGRGSGRFANTPTRWLSDGWEGWVPAPRLHGGGFANSPYQMVVRRVAGMGPRPPSSRGQDLDARTTGGGGAGRAVREQAPTRWLSDGWEGWVPAPRLHGGRISTRGQREGERDGRFANKPLPDGCQTGRRDGSPPPVFTGAGSRREDNGGRGVRVGGWG